MRWTIVALALGLSACGGGGGGGGGGSPPPQLLQLSRATIDFGAFATASVPPPVGLSGTVSGSPAAVFATVTTTTNGIEGVSTPQVSGSSATMTVFPRPPFTLQPGTYRDTITVRACPDAACSSQFQGSPATVNVTYVVGLDVSPASLSAQVVEGATPAAQNINMTYYAGNGSWTTSVVYSSGSDWLTVPASGTLPPGTFVAGFASRPAGNYAATLNITATGAVSQLRAVPVTYTVQPLLQAVAVQDIIVTNQQGASGQTRSSAVTSADPARNTAWTATVGAGAPWLTLDTATGTTGGASTLQMSLVASEVAKLRNGRYVTNVAIDPADPTASTLQLPVALNIDRTHVATVAPYVAADGTQAEVYIHGTRFDEVAIAAPGIRFGAFDAVSFTVESPTRMRAVHPALPAGHYDVTLVTSGQVGSSAELVVVEALAYEDAGKIATPLGAYTNYSEFDPERRACYNASQTQVSAAINTGPSWQTLVSPTTFSLIDGLRLTVDGRELLVADGNDIVHLDPATLVEIKRTDIASVQRVGSLARLADGSIAFTKSGEIRAYRPWTGTDSLLMTMSTGGEARANMTGNRVLWVFEPSFSHYRIFDSAGGPMLFQIDSPGFLAVASDRFARRWAFVPHSDTPVTVTDEDGTPFGAPFNARARHNAAMMSADGTKLVVGSFDAILGQPAYRVYDLTPLEGGGGPGDLGVAPVVAANQSEAMELLDNLFLTPHEGEVVACSRLRVGATALP
jgi:hypothetical protein